MNNYLIIPILLTILPVVIIATFAYLKDKHKEPFYIIILLFILGIVSGLAVLIISKLIEIPFPFLSKNASSMSSIELLIKVFLEIALVEELCKWLSIYITGYKSREFDESYDIVLYSVMTALGFATIENLKVIISLGTFDAVLQRSLISLPAHVSFQIFMSYFLLKARIYKIKNNKLKEKLSILESILIPTIIHGIFDFCLYTGNDLFIIFFILFIIILFPISFIRLREQYKNNTPIK